MHERTGKLHEKIVIAADAATAVQTLADGDLVPIQVDVADPQSVVARYGRLDAMIDCAEIVREFPFLETPVEEFVMGQAVRDEAFGRRLDRQHRGRLGPHGKCRPLGLRRIQRRRRDAEQGDGNRSRATGHSRQRHRARPRRIPTRGVLAFTPRTQALDRRNPTRTRSAILTG